MSVTRRYRPKPNKNVFDTVNTDDLRFLLPVLRKLADYDKGTSQPSKEDIV